MVLSYLQVRPAVPVVPGKARGGGEQGQEGCLGLYQAPEETVQAALCDTKGPEDPQL